MKSSKTGFAVIYRWEIRNGMEEQFKEAWTVITKLFVAERGALGSRLHKADDGTWVAYAQWPTREAWEQSNDLGPADPVASGVMAESTAEVFEPIPLEPVQDYLVGN